MSSHLMDEIRKLSVDERLALADEIFADLEAEADEKLAMLPGQQEELERRIAEYEADPSIGIPLETVLSELKARK